MASGQDAEDTGTSDTAGSTKYGRLRLPAIPFPVVAAYRHAHAPHRVPLFSPFGALWCERAYTFGDKPTVRVTGA